MELWLVSRIFMVTLPHNRPSHTEEYAAPDELAPLSSVVGGEPRRVSVRIGDHPGASQERRVKNGLAPLEGNFGACCHDGYPYQKKNNAICKAERAAANRA